MTAKVVRWTSFAFALLALAGCPEKDDDTDEKPSKDDKKEEPKPDPEPAPAPEPPKPTTLEPENSTPGVEPRVKAELDKREDGASGTSLNVAGGKGAFQLADGFTSKKNGKFDHAQKADGKSHFAATANTGDTTALVEEGTKALGLTECTWGVTESVTVGKDKVPATAADGVCKKGSEKVRTAQIVYSGDANVLAIGAWTDPGGDASSVFSIARSIKPVAGGGGADPIAACCAALRQNAASAPPQYKGAYLAAAGACQSLVGNPQGRAALGQVRALLAGANVPSTCR